MMAEHPICAAHKKLSDVYLYIFKQARQRADDYSAQALRLQKASKRKSKSPSMVVTAESAQKANKARELVSEAKGLRRRAVQYRDNIITYYGRWIDCGLKVAKKQTPRPLTYFERLMIVVWYPKAAATKLARDVALNKK